MTVLNPYRKRILIDPVEENIAQDLCSIVTHDLDEGLSFMD